MKKISLLLVLILLFSGFAAISTSAKEGKLIGYCVPDTTEPFLADLTNRVKKYFADDGVEVQIADAAGSASTQVSQIENFASMGADLIIVMAVDPTSVSDVIQRAQEAGSKVLVAGSDTGAYDSIMYIDQFEDGKMIAEMAVDWINETYPDAEPGSIKVGILESRDTPEASNRSDGMHEITNMSPAVEIVKVIGGIKKNADAQAATENMLLTNTDIRVILGYNSGCGLGANAVVMRPGSPIDDKSKFGVFCSDLDPQSLQAVKDSATNDSVLRGVVKIGGADLAYDTYKLATKMINGEPYDKKNPDKLTKITPGNADKYEF